MVCPIWNETAAFNVAITLSLSSDPSACRSAVDHPLAHCPTPSLTFPSRYSSQNTRSHCLYPGSFHSYYDLRSDSLSCHQKDPQQHWHSQRHSIDLSLAVANQIANEFSLNVTRRLYIGVTAWHDHSWGWTPGGCLDKRDINLFYINTIYLIFNTIVRT